MLPQLLVVIYGGSGDGGGSDGDSAGDGGGGGDTVSAENVNGSDEFGSGDLVIVIRHPQREEITLRTKTTPTSVATTPTTTVT